MSLFADEADVSSQSVLYLTFQEGKCTLEINVQVFDDGEIEIEMNTSYLKSEDPVEFERESWDTQNMPASIGLKLRDFLNYAYRNSQE